MNEKPVDDFITAETARSYAEAAHARVLEEHPWGATMIQDLDAAIEKASREGNRSSTLTITNRAHQRPDVFRAVADVFRRRGFEVRADVPHGMILAPSITVAW